MGCLWSRFGLPSPNSPVAPVDFVDNPACSGKNETTRAHNILAAGAVSENTGEGSAQPASQRYPHVIVRDHRHREQLPFKAFSGPEDADPNLDGRDDENQQTPPELQKNSEDIIQVPEGKTSANILSQSNIGTIQRSDPVVMSPRNKGKAPQTSSVETSAADVASGSRSTPQNWEESCLDDLVPLDHDMLWAILGSRPGWERVLREGLGDSPDLSINKGWIIYKLPILNETPNGTFRFASYRLPWPDLSAESTLSLRGFVKRVNLWAGSEIFKLRRTSNDPPKWDVGNSQNFTATSRRLLPQHDMVRDGSRSNCAAFEDRLRTTMERDPREGAAPSSFRSFSPAFLDLDPTTGKIRRAAEGQPVTPTHAPRSDQIHSAETSEQTATAPPNLFANVLAKPVLGPPPVLQFSGKKEQPSSTPAANCDHFLGLPAGGRRGQPLLTFATPYQTPPRLATQTHSRTQVPAYLRNEDHAGPAYLLRKAWSF